jgi:hypothetical protein
MKKLLLALSVLALMSVGVNAQTPNCAAEIIGAAPNPAQPTICVLQDGSQTDCLLISTWNDPGTFANRKIVVTYPTLVDGALVDIIQGVSDDGTYNFGNDGTGNPYPVGMYKFTAFAFNQSELDALAATLNPLLPILTYPTIPIPADLAQVFAVLSGVLGPISILDVEGAICDFLPSILPTATLPYSVSDNPYEVSVVAAGCTCGVGIDDVNNDYSFNVSVSPVPAYNFVELNVQTIMPQTKVAVYDVTGKLVENFTTSDKKVTLDINRYQAGMYVVSVSNGTITKNTKFVKQ